VSADENRFRWNHATLCLDALCRGVESAFDYVEELIEQLIGVKRVEIEEALANDIVDLWQETSYGYSFLDSCDATSEPVLHRLLETFGTELWIPTENGSSLDSILGLRILQQLEEIQTLICILGFISVGQLPRAIEWMRHAYRNGHRPRTIFIVDGVVWFVIRQLKYESLVNHTGWIPHKANHRYTSLFLFYIRYLRPVEKEFAAVLHGVDYAMPYNEFMWVIKGQAVNTKWFYDAFPDFMTKYCGAVNVGVQAYRQIIVEVSRRYMGNESLDMLNTDDDEDIITLAQG
jgi:hypothetical protein